MPGSIQPSAPPPWLPFIAFGVVAGACAPGALGVACGMDLSPHAVWWLAGAPLAVLATFAARRWPLAARWGAFAAACLLGGALAVPGLAPERGPTRLLEVRGEVETVKNQFAPKPGRQPWFGQVLRLIRCRTLDPAGWPPPDRLSLLAPGLPGARPGDMVVARGTWTVDAYGESLDVVALEDEAREEGPRGFAWRAVGRFGAHSELAGSLLLGRGNPPERNDFRAAGLAHVLAVSGVHLAIAAGLLAWLLRSLGLGWAPRLLTLGAFLAGYCWLTHGSPATVRALAMFLATMLAALSWREPHRLGPVAGAALVLVAMDPTIAHDVGFQLSLAAILGIVTLGADLVALRQRLLPLTPWPLDRPTWRAALWSARSLCDGVAMGLAASLATVPLVVWYFGKVAPWAWLTSLAAGIPATLALWAGLPLLILAGLFPGGPWEGLYRITGWSLDALAGTVHWSALNLPQRPTDQMPPWLICAWPLLFIRLRDAWDLGLRLAAVTVLLLAW